MRVFGVQSRDDFVPNSFVTQYISIILIIITCIVWAYFADPKRPLNSAGAAATRPVPIDGHAGQSIILGKELSVMPVEHLFDPATAAVQEEAAEAYVSFLSSHDIDAEFEIRMKEAPARRGFTLAKNLAAYFVSKGIPETAVEVFVLPGAGEDSVMVRFKTEGGRSEL